LHARRRVAARQVIARAALKFFEWAFEQGDEMATGLDYVPLPDNVVKLVEETWAKGITANGKPVWNP
jgi:phosphate transport system substrate-binding protein